MPGNLLDALGRVIVTFQAPGQTGRVWDELRPWMSKLLTTAAPKWLPRLTFGYPCQVPVHQHGQPVGPCTHNAVSICDVCGRSCCLYHGRIDHLGDAICYLCVAEAVQAKRGSGPKAKGPETTEDAAWARKVLGVKKNAKWDDVKSQYRKKSAESHPDKQQTEAGKKTAEDRFKKVQRAFEVLQREHERKAA